MNNAIVYFDGYCGLCNRFVDFLLAVDRRHQLRFSPLKNSDSFESIVLLDEGERFRESDAVLRALWHVGGVWRATVALRIIPKFVRDFVYRWIAKNRYGWFGRRDSCRLPSAEERQYFIA